MSKMLQDIEMIHESKNFQLDERAAPISPELSAEQAIEELEKRLAAAKRALSLAHKLKDPLEKKRHFSAILGNMNASRSQLSRVIKQLEMFTRAEKSYELGKGYSVSESKDDTIKHHRSKWVLHANMAKLENGPGANWHASQAKFHADEYKRLTGQSISDNDRMSA